MFGRDRARWFPRRREGTRDPDFRRLALGRLGGLGGLAAEMLRYTGADSGEYGSGIASGAIFQVCWVDHVVEVWDALCTARVMDDGSEPECLNGVDALQISLRSKVGTNTRPPPPYIFPILESQAYPRRSTRSSLLLIPANTVHCCLPLARCQDPPKIWGNKLHPCSRPGLTAPQSPDGRLRNATVLCAFVLQYPCRAPGFWALPVACPPGTVPCLPPSKPPLPPPPNNASRTIRIANPPRDGCPRDVGPDQAWTVSGHTQR